MVLRQSSLSGSEFRWYVINVYSGLEKKFIASLQESAEKKKLSDRFQEFLVPTEEVMEIKGGQKVIKERQYFPGYILAKMALDDEVWHLVRSTPKFASFLGPNGKPSPISEREVTRIMSQVQESAEKPRNVAVFEVGEHVRVADGPFASFNGIVEDVDRDKGRVKVSVTIFGRATPVELEFTQVEKI